MSALLEDFLTAASPDIKELAEDAGLSYATVHSWITKRRKPRAHNLTALLEAWERRKAATDRLGAELRKAARDG